MKTYHGYRTPTGAKVDVLEHGFPARPLDLRLDLYNHSPAGFNWGYGGSGPSQLALAILADAVGVDDTAVRLHQEFKWAKISDIDEAGFTMSLAEVITWVKLCGRVSE